MKILQLDLIHFGKFHQKTLRFRDGLQIIQGENEAGKTTIHRFIRAMLFGLERSAAAELRPWDAPETCSGSMELEWKGRIYRIYRSFAKGNQSLLVTDLTTGTRYTREEEWQEILSPMTKGLLDNVIYIGQETGAQAKTVAGDIAAYLANVFTSGSQEIDVRSALEQLEKKQKVLKGSQTAQKLEEARGWAGEAVSLDERIRQLEAEIQRLESANKGAEEDFKGRTDLVQQYPLMQEKEMRLQEIVRRKNAQGKWLKIGWTICLLGVAAASFIRVELALLPILVMAGLINMEKKLKADDTLEVLEQEVQSYYEDCLGEEKDSEQRAALLQEKVHKWSSELQAESRQYSDRKQQLERLDWELEQAENALAEAEEWEQKKTALEECFQRERLESQALELAVRTIKEQARALQGTFGQRVREKASGYFERLTSGHHETLLLDENYVLTAREGIWYPGIGSLSKGAAEKAWLAVRLAMGEELGEEPLCYMLDDVFAFYDDQSLETALEVLKDVAAGGHQILLFTCHSRELNWAGENDIWTEKM